MLRLLLSGLLNWKNQKFRKPLLLDGARQTGKTYLIEKLFGHGTFAKVHKFDFREDKNLHRYFKDDLNPTVILKNLQLHQGHDIDLERDLIFFDEVGECQGAIDALKYFYEKMPTIYLCSSGSNIGLLESFPVGAVHIEELYPLTFEEFLMAAGEADLLDSFHARFQLEAAHARLWSLLLDYYFVGGMPEAVAYWFDSHERGINERCQSVAMIHKNILGGFYRDFGKYSGKVNALHIESVFNNIPIQLARSIDDSVRRYAFKAVIAQKKRYLDLATPIEWLCKAKLSTKNYIIPCQPINPMRPLVKENIFKLFLFDVGLLGHLLEISYREQRDQKMIFKGFLAENFVQCELIATGRYTHTYSWSEGNAEIEFIIKNNHGDLIPVEVKSGRRTQAKSLKVYQEKYAPSQSVKLVGKVGGGDKMRIIWPLYYAKYLIDL